MNIADMIAEGHLQTDEAYDEGALVPADDVIALRSALIACGHDMPLLGAVRPATHPTVDAD